MSAPDAPTLLIRKLAERSPQAAQLARYASLAVRVDPALLRSLRLDMLPGSEPGVESDLWFSGLPASRGSEGFVLDDGVCEVLRDALRVERLPDGRRALDVAWQLTQRAHAGWPEALRIEETVTWLALGGGGRRRATLAAAIDQAFRPALLAMAADEERAQGVARWALRLVPRLPHSARASEAATALRLAAMLVLDNPLAELPEAGLSPMALRILPPSLLKRLNRRLRLVAEIDAQGLWLRHARRQDPKDEVIELPATDPPMVELTWAQAGGGSRHPVEPVGQRLCAVQPGVPLPLPARVRDLRLRTLEGAQYALTRPAPSRTTSPAARPAMALALPGGGVRGAFAWGVIEGLVEAKAPAGVAISGVGIGAVMACLLATLATAGARLRSTEGLAVLWSALEDSVLAGSTAYSPVAGGAFSPYQFNPLALNPLRDVLYRTIDIRKVRESRLQIFVTATEVATGRPRVFTNTDISHDALLASLCDPISTQAVQVDGVAYWGGQLSGNPPLWPLIYEASVGDILVIDNAPESELAEAWPTDRDELAQRMRDRATLLRESTMIEWIGQLRDQGVIDAAQYRSVRLHRVVMPAAVRRPNPGTRPASDDAKVLRDMGRAAMAEWLERHPRWGDGATWAPMATPDDPTQTMGPPGADAPLTKARGASTPRGSAVARRPKVIRLSLVMDAMGAMGAIGCGAIERLQEQPGLELVSISATGSDALSAGVVATARRRGVRVSAALESLWQDLYKTRVFSPPNGSFKFGPRGRRGDGDTLQWRELLQVIRDHIDDKAMHEPVPALWIGATDLRRGVGRSLSGAELSLEVFAAAASLPEWHSAVPYHDALLAEGSFVGCPLLAPALRSHPGDDLLWIQTTPWRRPELPQDLQDIKDRLAELSGIAALEAEFRHLDVVARLVMEQRLSPGPQGLPRLHRIDASATVGALDRSAMRASDPALLEQLRLLGRDSASRWLAAEGDALGMRSSLNVRSELLDRS